MFRVAASTVAALSASYLGYETYRDGHLDLYNVGIARLGRAALTVASIGLDYKQTLSRTKNLVPESEEFVSSRSACHQRSAEKLLRLCTKNGGCYVKVGQHIGALDFLLPEEYVSTMKVLHSGVPPVPLEDVYAVIREDLGGDPEDLFCEFDETPLGTASLAQVHRARLRIRHNQTKDADGAKDAQTEDGANQPIVAPHPGQEDDKAAAGRTDSTDASNTLASPRRKTPSEDTDAASDPGPWVAVKVQHRHVARHSRSDIRAMDLLVRAVKRSFPQFEFMWLAEEMRAHLELELDFVRDARNSEKVATQLDHYDWLRVPRIYWQQTTDRVLTMEYCEGSHIDDAEYMKRHNINPATVTNKIGQLYADMIFKFGYLHCDPHPGNIMVQKSDKPGKFNIVLLDHGLYTQLSEEFRLNLANLFLSIARKDESGIREFAERFGVRERRMHSVFACILMGRSWSSIVGEKGSGSNENNEVKMKARQHLPKICSLMATIDRQFSYVLKTIYLLRGIGSKLNSNNNSSCCCSNSTSNNSSDSNRSIDETSTCNTNDETSSSISANDGNSSLSTSTKSDKNIKMNKNSNKNGDITTDVPMARACYRFLDSHRYGQCRSAWERVRVTLVSHWHQFVISCFVVLRRLSDYLSFF